MSRIEPAPAGAVDTTTLGAAAVRSTPAGAHALPDPEDRPVQKGFDPDPPQTTEPAGEHLVEGAAPTGPEGSQQEGMTPEQRLLAGLVDRVEKLGQKESEVQTEKATPPEQKAQEEVLRDQQETLRVQMMESVGALEAQLAETQKQMEDGDLDMPVGLSRQAALQRQLLQTENQFSKQIDTIDLRLESMQMQSELKVRQAREDFLQNEREFGEFYQTTYNQKYKNDPVYGDPVAAYYKERFDASEAEKSQLQQQLQMQAETVAKAKPGVVKGDSAGDPERNAGKGQPRRSTGNFFNDYMTRNSHLYDAQGNFVGPQA